MARRTVSWHRLAAYLRHGGHPEEFPGSYVIGSGISTYAWRIGNYVVKRNRHHICRTRHRPPVRKLQQDGLRAPKQWCIRGWIVQPFYRRTHIPRVYSRGRLDVHPNNLGRDNRGRLVAFDW